MGTWFLVSHGQRMFLLSQAIGKMCRELGRVLDHASMGLFTLNLTSQLSALCNVVA